MKKILSVIIIMAIVLTTNGVYVNASEVDHTEELATLE